MDLRGGGLLLALILLVPVPSGALDTAEEIRACLSQNAPKRSILQRVQMHTFDRVGGERRFEAKLYWKRGEDGLSKLLLRVVEPPDLRCTAYLAVERRDTVEMFTYLPEIKRVRRIHPRSISIPILGTRFTWEDIVRLQDVAGHSSLERLPDSDVDGRPAYVLAARPDEAAESSYGRIVTFVDQKTCVLLRAEFFDFAEDPKPIKLLRADIGSLTDEGGIWLARNITMQDLVGGGESQLFVKKIEFDIDIPDTEFSQSRLGRCH